MLWVSLSTHCWDYRMDVQISNRKLYHVATKLWLCLQQAKLFVWHKEVMCHPQLQIEADSSKKSDIILTVRLCCLHFNSLSDSFFLNPKLCFEFCPWFMFLQLHTVNVREDAWRPWEDKPSSRAEISVLDKAMRHNSWRIVVWRKMAWQMETKAIKS